MQFLSTPSARRATRQRGPCRHHRSISIHALREEGDAYEPDRQRPRADFYPRPPRGGRQHGPTTDISPVKYFYPRPPRGGRPRACAFRACVRIFLSTPSARRATIRTKSMLPVWCISIHALREEGDVHRHASGCLVHISIHALREEGDLGNTAALSVTTIFLSTPSARRATVTQAIRGQWPTYFYPRPPRGGRHQPDFIADFYFIFLSTPSARRATSHPPWCRCSAVYFYPRPPRGGRLFVPNRLLWEH